MYTISILLALFSRASEEATFAFEASRWPQLIRPLAWNPNQAITKVDIQVHDAVRTHAPEEALVEAGNEHGGAFSGRAPTIRYADEKEAHGEDWHELTPRGV